VRLLATIATSALIVSGAPSRASGEGAREKSIEAGASRPSAKARTERKRSKKKVVGTKASCLRALDALGVKYKRAKRRGLRIGVRIRGDLGGVTYRSYKKKALVIDCSLAVSLAAAGRFLVDHGVDTATYSSAYHIRNIRGTRRRSNHSYGLAIDVHTLSGEELGTLTLKEDFEQGLGDEIDCIGQPLTQAGAVLRAIDCQLERSGLFRIVLGPDYDATHYNHFHIEARPWRKREDAGADWGQRRQAVQGGD